MLEFKNFVPRPTGGNLNKMRNNMFWLKEKVEKLEAELAALKKPEPKKQVKKEVK